MRKKLPEYGDKRIRSGFLFFPLSVHHNSIYGQEERWLEFATWEEEFKRAGWGPGWWMMRRFIDDPKEIKELREKYQE